MSYASGPGRIARLKLAVAGVFVVLLAAGQASAASTWNLGADFSIASNPNGAWSYGSMPYLAGVPDASAFTLYTSATPDVPLFVGAGASTVEGRFNAPVDPNVTHNYGASDYTNFGITWSPGEVSIGPGVNTGNFDAISGVRWTAPAAGLYEVFAQFEDNQINASGADVYVLVNGVPVYTEFAGTTPEAGPSPYTTFAPLFLNAGQTIDFVVGSAYGPNNTEVAAIIAQVPEPASWVMLSLGGVVLLSRLKRRVK